MADSLEKILQTYPRRYFTDAELHILLKSTSDSRHSKVKRWLASGKLLRLRRGLYSVTDRGTHAVIAPHPYELAQYIYGPSYISLESALSFHGLIPETVYTIMSVTTKRAHEFHTPLGMFSYTHLPPLNFYIDVTLIKENQYTFFMAKPWKAICDYVFCYKKNWSTLSPLFESLRILPEQLPQLTQQEIIAFNAYYRSQRIRTFLKGISQGMHHKRKAS